jgi:PAS domain S-box-containing protein
MRGLGFSAAFAAVSIALYLGGILSFADRALMDARFALLERQASGQVAIIAIDPESLQRIGVWPWPRSFHAQLLDRLTALGVGHIAYDIDFSTRSTPTQDARLAEALAAHRPPVILPAFRQFASPQDTNALITSLPLPVFARHATIASINLRPDSDGVVRQVEPVQPFDDLLFPFMAARLAAAQDVRRQPFHLDFGIRADTVPVFGFSEVLFGGGADLAGRDVLIGSTAVELGDQLAVPHYDALPGVLVQALAYESLTQNRALSPLPPWAIAAATLALALAAFFLTAHLRWPGATLVFAATVVAVVGLSVGLQAVAPVFVDVAPLLLTALLSYALALVQTIGRQEADIARSAAEAHRWRRGLQAVFDASFDAILRVGRHGDIRDMNDAARAQFGTKEEMTVKDTLAVPAGAIPGGDGDESLAKRSDGSFFTARVNVADVDDEERIAVIHDSTEEKLLQREAARFFNLSQDLIAVVNSDGRIMRVNPTWRRTLGIDPAELVGSNFAWLLKGTDAPDLRDFLARKPTHEISQAFEAPVQSRKGHERWFHWIVVLSPEDDAAFISGRETSDRRRTKALKDAFITTIGRELRTPLTALRGALKHLTGEADARDSETDPTQLLKIADRNSDRLNRLISNILDMQDIQSGAVDDTFEPVTLSDVVREVIDDHVAATQDNGLTVALTDRSSHSTVLGNADQLGRVISNLLSNAIKAAPPGTAIRIELAAGNDHVKVSVQDQGPGIPETIRGEIFDRFTHFGAHGGGGLGLSIAKAFVKQHRGTISFASKKDGGTTFTVTLPRFRGGSNVIPLPRTDTLH